MVTLLGASIPTRGRPARTEITITGTDYAFIGVPEKLPAGQAFFAFKNAGKVRHELSIARLKTGFSADSAFAVLKRGPGPRNFVHGNAALIIGGPGQDPLRARVVFDLRKGETYIIICTLRDSPDAPPHSMLGMYATFRVE